MTNRMPRALAVLVTLSLVTSLPSSAGAQGASGRKATTERQNGQSALLFLEEADRNAFMQITRDAPANMTWLSYAYRTTDPDNSSLKIQISGEGEIPNEAFSTSPQSARLTLTTPDSFPVIRCVIDEESGEVNCEPTGPSTFDLTWLADGYGTIQGRSTSVETLGTVLFNGRATYEEVTAPVGGLWNGQAFTSPTGFLSNARSSSLFRDTGSAANRLLRVVQAPAERFRAALGQNTRNNGRQAYGFLDVDGLQGFARAIRNEFTRTSHLRFGYVFPDEANPGQSLFYFGDGEIVNEAFDVTGSSARLTISTAPTFPVTRCVITGVVGDPGAVTCAPFTAPVTLDLTWAADGYGAVHQTDSTIETFGSTTTSSHRQFNQVTTRMAGTWSETTGHAASDMSGFLLNYQDVTVAR